MVRVWFSLLFLVVYSFLKGGCVMSKIYFTDDEIKNIKGALDFYKKSLLDKAAADSHHTAGVDALIAAHYENFGLAWAKLSQNTIDFSFGETELIYKALSYYQNPENDPPAHSSEAVFALILLFRSMRE
jgi:hypothetical protein